MAQGRITNPKAALTFMTAGKATVTFRSAESGVRFTYKIRLAPKRNPNDADTWFVQLLNGPDNTGNFCYIGILRRDNGVYHYVWTSKARVNQSCASVKAFQYALDCFAKSSIPEKLEVYHEGRCGRCGRKLTVPESVTSGFGPECIGLVGGAVPQAVIASGYAAPQRGLHFDYVTIPEKAMVARVSGRASEYAIPESHAVGEQRSSVPNVGDMDVEIRRMVGEYKTEAPENFYQDGELDEKQAFNVAYNKFRVQLQRRTL